MEKINILMATYNGRRYVAKQIESILNQTYQDFRLIISDDCSSDSTLKILEEYEAKDKRIEIFYQGENLGVQANFEFLIGKVRSEYFMFSDQDDIWEPDKIEKSVKKLEEENLDLVYTDLSVVDSRLNEIAPSYWKLKGLDYRIKKYNNFESLYLNNFVTGCTMLVRSKWINEFMPFPKKSKYILHDYWISLIVSQNGKIGYIDEALVKYRQHKDNKIGSKTRSEQMKTLDDIRNLFIDVKIDHFMIFVQNENKFKTKAYQELNRKALQYYENLKNVNKFSLKGIGTFLKLYKYETFDYRLKNMAILHAPGLARPYFQKMKEKRELEESMKRKEELEAKMERKKKAKERKEEKQKKAEAREKKRREKEKQAKTKAKKKE
ncbi:MAG: glycosyltransferase family 2 protein [Clostridia bacterium]|nr:glycosyltransferase family 2 protein [Clostridia bacterium]